VVDTFTKEKRSEIMSKVRATNTKPETVVRKWLHRNGYRFRLHGKELPGKPDIVLPKHKTVINVHGCFWHRHQGCKHATTPQSNTDYWEGKFKRNIERDRANKNQLEDAGWKVIVIWECEVRNKTFKEKINSSGLTSSV